MKIRYGSVCSGVEAASLAWMPLGWECAFVSEVEPFLCAVLHHRFGAGRPIHPLDPAEIVISDEEWKIIDGCKKENPEKWRKVIESNLLGRYDEYTKRVCWIRQNSKLPETGTIPNEGDFTKIGDKYRGKIDLLVGGTPCQSFSVAGKRAGLAGVSGLALDFIRLAYESQVKWVVWENVPGCFSTNGGRDFGAFLSGLSGIEIAPPGDGWRTAGFVRNHRRDRFGLAWRVLDAQFTRVPGFPFAIPQRRRRVFVVGCFGDWERAAAVLLEPDRLSWDTPPCRTTRQAIASGSESCIDEAIRQNRECFDIRQVEIHEKEIAPTLIATDYKGGKAISFYPQRKAESMVPLEECSNTLVNGTCPGHQNAVCFENHGNDSRITESPGVSPTITSRAGTGGNNLPLVMGNETNVCPTLEANLFNKNTFQDCEKYVIEGRNDEPIGFIKNDAGGEQQGFWTGAFPTIRSQVIPAVAIAENVIGRQVENGGNGIGAKEEVAYTQNCTGVMGVCQNATVRRLLPVECERLMGFPDNYTRIPWGGKPEEECPDSPRYKACGNSMCRNVMEWIGRRINENEEMEEDKK